MSIGYLLDENVDPRLKAELLRDAPDIAVWLLGEPGAPALGSPDEDILDWCELHQFILITHNRASMPVHLRDRLAAGGHSPGIFVIRPKATLAEIIEELALIWAAGEPNDYLDRLVYIPEVLRGRLV